MKILHIVPGLDDPTNGIAVAAKLIAAEQSKANHEVEVIDTRDFVQSSIRTIRTIEQFSEVWVHSMWLPRTMRAVWKVLRNARMFKCLDCSNVRTRLVRMPHGCMDPVKVAYHWHKKRWIVPIEKWLFRRCDRIVSTEVAEDEWIRMFVGEKCPPIERISLNHPTFVWSKLPPLKSAKEIMTVLYIGRLHPLKGVRYLIQALPKGVKLVVIGKDDGEGAELKALAAKLGAQVDFRGIVSEEEKAESMRTCDLFVLPTLSENYGLVVEEVLRCGKRVITTDGAPAWEPRGEGEPWRERLLYLRGFRDGTDEERVRLLVEAIKEMGGKDGSLDS